MAEKWTYDTEWKGAPETIRIYGIAERLELPRSTVSNHLTALGMGKLPALHPPPVVCYVTGKPPALYSRTA